MKKPLHSFGQRVPKCTPNFRLSPKKFFEKIYPFTCSHWEAPNYRVFMKNFLSGKKPSHLFGIAKPNDTLFHRKNEKIFLLGWGWLYFLAEKAPSLIPTGDGRMHTLNRKKIPSLVPTGRGYLGIVISKKGKKICPPI